jgi:hypothetical protein
VREHTDSHIRGLEVLGVIVRSGLENRRRALAESVDSRVLSCALVGAVRGNMIRGNMSNVTRADDEGRGLGSRGAAIGRLLLG